jgi:regulator of cell morphogenesis and NO signaling
LLFFEHFGITLPVQDKTLETVCEENGLSLRLVITFANLFNGVTQVSDPELSFDDTKAIILYLKNSHEFYSDEIYPEILNTIEQMAKVNDSSEMSLVKKFFTDYFTEVNEHLDYENKVVFPYVLELYERIKKGNNGEKNKEYSVVEYRDQHNDIEEKLDDLKKLLIKYLPKKNDRILRRKLLLSLFELDYDLTVHSQIEEFILIPLVEKMESYLKTSK